MRHNASFSFSPTSHKITKAAKEKTLLILGGIVAVLIPVVAITMILTGTNTITICETERNKKDAFITIENQVLTEEDLSLFSELKNPGYVKPDNCVLQAEMRWITSFLLQEI